MDLEETALDPKLHIVIAVGAPALGWLFSKCWDDRTQKFYTTLGNRPFCVDFEDLMAFDALPFKWLVAASICLILLSVYRLWSKAQ